MYVEPMGRWVIWYMYASDFTEGNTTDMNTLMVTEPSVNTQTEPSQESVEISVESAAEAPVEISVEDSFEETSQIVEGSIQQSSTEYASTEETSTEEASRNEPLQEESRIQESSAPESSKPESAAEESSEISMMPLPEAESVSKSEVQTPQTSHSEEYAPDNTRGLILSTEKEVGEVSDSSGKPNSTILWVIVTFVICAAVTGVIVFIVKTKAKVKLNKEDDMEEYDEDGDDND